LIDVSPTQIFQLYSDVAGWKIWDPRQQVTLGFVQVGRLTEINVQQSIGREGETATLFLRCVLNLNGLGGGFAPRHLNRWATSFALHYRFRIDV